MGNACRIFKMLCPDVAQFTGFQDGHATRVKSELENQVGQGQTRLLGKNHFAEPNPRSCDQVEQEVATPTETVGRLDGQPPRPRS